jgi:hypothetical protein
VYKCVYACVNLSQGRCALTGDLGEPLNALHGHVCDGTLEPRPGRRHDPRDGRGKILLQRAEITQQVIEQSIEHLLLHCCYTVDTHFLRFCYNLVTLFSRCSYTSLVALLSLSCQV